VAARPPGVKGFAALPRRWAVERSFAWVGRDHRLGKEYAALLEASEAMVRATFGSVVLRRSPSSRLRKHPLVVRHG
jgi:putative transposase